MGCASAGQAMALQRIPSQRQRQVPGVMVRAIDAKERSDFIRRTMAAALQQFATNYLQVTLAGGAARDRRAPDSVYRCNNLGALFGDRSPEVGLEKPRRSTTGTGILPVTF